MNRRSFVTMLLGFAVLPWVRTAKALAVPSVLSPALPAAAPTGPLLRCVPDWCASEDGGKVWLSMMHQFSRPPTAEELAELGLGGLLPVKTGACALYAEQRAGLDMAEAQKLLASRSPYQLPWLMPGNVYRYVATPDDIPFPPWRDPNEPLPVARDDDEDDDVDDWDSYWDHDEEHDPL